MNLPQSMPLAVMKALLSTNLLPTGGFHNPTLCLQSAPLPPSPSLTLASMTEPTFTGYARQASLVPGTVFNQPTDEGARTVYPTVPFICSGGTPTDQIYGWFLIDNAGTTLLLYVPLDTPVPIAEVGDGVVVDCEFWYSGN